jgi:hypothetical protein
MKSRLFVGTLTENRFLTGAARSGNWLSIEFAKRVFLRFRVLRAEQ